MLPFLIGGAVLVGAALLLGDDDEERQRELRRERRALARAEEEAARQVQEAHARNLAAREQQRLGLALEAAHRTLTDMEQAQHTLMAQQQVLLQHHSALNKALFQLNQIERQYGQPVQELCRQERERLNQEKCITRQHLEALQGTVNAHTAQVCAQREALGHCLQALAQSSPLLITQAAG